MDLALISLMEDAGLNPYEFRVLYHLHAKARDNVIRTSEDKISIATKLPAHKIGPVLLSLQFKGFLVYVLDPSDEDTSATFYLLMYGKN
jgi:hypothetical protein